MAENPPAFPRTGEGFGNANYDTPGMTLRDYFAAHAPEPPSTWWGNGPKTSHGYAMWAFQHAEAMLLHRAARETSHDS